MFFQSVLLVPLYIPTAKQNLVSSVKNCFLGIGSYDIFLISAHLLHSVLCAGIEALYLQVKYVYFFSLLHNRHCFATPPE